MSTTNTPVKNSAYAWFFTGLKNVLMVCGLVAFGYIAGGDLSLRSSGPWFSSSSQAAGDAVKLADNPLTRDMSAEFPSTEPPQWKMTFLDMNGVSKGFSRLRHVDHEIKDGRTVLGIPVGTKRIIRFGAYRSDKDKWKPNHLSMVYSGASDSSAAEKFDGRCEPRFASSPTTGLFTLQPGTWVKTVGGWTIQQVPNHWAGIVHPENRKDMSERFIIQKLF